MKTLPLLPLALCVAVALSACGNPCGNIWKKLDKCATTEADGKLYRSAESRKAFVSQCKKADKSHIKKCLILKDCDKIRLCASRIQKK